MGPVIGLTFTQGPAMAFAVFFTLGAGLAAPFLLMAAFPRLARVMPRPGAWMKTFKEVMAFLMYFAAAGVLWALTVQAGTGALAAALFGGLVLAAALYVFGKAQTARGDMGRRLGFGGAAVTAALALFITVGGTLSPGLVAADDAATTASAASGEALSDLAPKGFDHRENWSEARIDALQAEGKAVFVDFTASWCVTCLANKRVALNRDATRDFFNERDITFMTADWSRRDERIAKALESYGRAGVPLYVYYPSHGGQARILPQVLTVDTVLDAIKAAEAEGAAQSARRPNSPTSDEGA
jgi:thiol:disulfide interchange protein DsbD